MVHLQFLKSEKNCISGEMFHKKKYIENNKNNRKDMTDNDEKLNVLSIVKIKYLAKLHPDDKGPR